MEKAADKALFGQSSHKSWSEEAELDTCAPADRIQPVIQSKVHEFVWRTEYRGPIVLCWCCWSIMMCLSGISRDIAAPLLEYFVDWAATRMDAIVILCSMDGG